MLYHVVHYNVVKWKVKLDSFLVVKRKDSSFRYNKWRRGSDCDGTKET